MEIKLRTWQFKSRHAQHLHDITGTPASIASWLAIVFNILVE